MCNARLKAVSFVTWHRRHKRDRERKKKLVIPTTRPRCHHDLRLLLLVRAILFEISFWRIIGLQDGIALLYYCIILSELVKRCRKKNRNGEILLIHSFAIFFRSFYFSMLELQELKHNVLWSYLPYLDSRISFKKLMCVYDTISVNIILISYFKKFSRFNQCCCL